MHYPKSIKMADKMQNIVDILRKKYYHKLMKRIIKCTK